MGQARDDFLVEDQGDRPRWITQSGAVGGIGSHEQSVSLGTARRDSDEGAGEHQREGAR
jgi:hypothetical protein